MNRSLAARIRRIQRQRRIARLVLRLLRLDEVEVLPVGEYSVAFSYVTLCNDQDEVIRAARDVAAQRSKPLVLGMGLMYTSARAMDRLVDRARPVRRGACGMKLWEPERGRLLHRHWASRNRYRRDHRLALRGAPTRRDLRGRSLRHRGVAVMDNLDTTEAIEYLYPVLRELYEDEVGDMDDGLWRADAAEVVKALESKGLFLATNLRQSDPLGLGR